MKSNPFRVVAGKGFQLTFENGWTISVMFGDGNYCEHRSSFSTFGINDHKSKDAEIAIWHSEADLTYKIQSHDTAAGWLSADDVADWINRVKNFARPEDFK